jgi:hypothetical protein
MSGSGTNPLFNVSGSLAATGSSESFKISKPFNLTLSGTWVGTVALEASTDGGTTFVNCPMPDGTASAFAINGLYPAPNVFQQNVRFRVTFTRTSGTVEWRFSR